MRGVREARSEDLKMLATLQSRLWPEGKIDEHLAEVDSMLSSGMYGTVPAVMLVAENDNGDLIGFLQASLRSHADGCDPEQPVGFIEGWFVNENERGKGVGGELENAAEAWARAHGCREVASDALIDILPSQRAHLALGFEIVDRCVHFRKAL
jgi:aminoglycoside 6'-N-acetyltransferase I